MLLIICCGFFIFVAINRKKNWKKKQLIAAVLLCDRSKYSIATSIAAVLYGPQQITFIQLFNCCGYQGGPQQILLQQNEKIMRIINCCDYVYGPHQITVGLIYKIKTRHFSMFLFSETVLSRRTQYTSCF